MIFHYIFCIFLPKNLCPSVYVMTVTLDKLQKQYGIPNGAEPGFLSY